MFDAITGTKREKEEFVEHNLGVTVFRIPFGFIERLLSIGSVIKHIIERSF